MAETRLILKKVSNGAETEVAGELTAGRLAECGLQLVEGNPSRRHARITVDNGDVWVEDLTSRNGTFVNGRRIGAKTRLSSGDRLKFDVEEFDFRAERAASGADDQTMASALQQEALAASGNKPPLWIRKEAVQEGSGKTEFISRDEIRRMQGQPSSLAAPSNIDAPHLVIYENGRPGPCILLRSDGSGKAEWTVGSGPDCAVRLNYSGVSAYHAKIVNEGARWKLSDQTSVNGTFVNGKQCIVSYLSSGARLRFGPVECVFQLPVGKTAARRKPRSRKTLILIALISFIVAIILVVAFMRFR